MRTETTQHPGATGHGRTAVIAHTWDMESPEIVYIVGSGHCGSTLLGLLLSRHPEVEHVGEVKDLGARRETTPPDGDEVSTSFWRAVGHGYQERTGQTLETASQRPPRFSDAMRMHGRPLEAWGRRTTALLDAVGEVADARIVVDSSKNHARALLLCRTAVSRVRVIHLERDGRAVVRSYRRKGRSLPGALRRWLAPTLGALLVRRLSPATPWLTVSYSSLTEDPEQELRRICGFLGLEYRPAMLAFEQGPDHSIGGNRMKLARSGEIRRDVAWRHDRPTVDRVAFALFGGWLNVLRTRAHRRLP